ncbi:uncharacterized protein [Miscanthus floridulus]|uniref:uncharacterized protein n=1 Tax=Miscanthus floridulus TaxID=154761 RepID=UPI0034599CA6
MGSARPTPSKPYPHNHSPPPTRRRRRRTRAAARSRSRVARARCPDAGIKPRPDPPHRRFAPRRVRSRFPPPRPAKSAAPGPTGRCPAAPRPAMPHRTTDAEGGRRGRGRRKERKEEEGGRRGRRGRRRRGRRVEVGGGREERKEEVAFPFRSRRHHPRVPVSSTPLPPRFWKPPRAGEVLPKFRIDPNLFVFHAGEGTV